MEIDPEAETYVYLQLAAILRAQIDAGELTRRVPSVNALAARYQVARGSAEKALEVLRDEGRIRAVIGRGYFVVQPGS